MFDMLAWGFLGMTAGFILLLMFLWWEHSRGEGK